MRSCARSLLLFLFGMGATSVLAGAGCGLVAKNSPAVGGESHFLHWCDGSCDEKGLECISGLCTQPCVVAEPGACSSFTGATCTDRSIEPGAVAICDVACTGDADCALLGGDYQCQASFCRAPQRGASSSMPSDVGASAGGASASDLMSSGGSGGALGTPSAEPICAPSCPTPDWVEWNMRGGIGPGMFPGLGGWPSLSLLTGCSYWHEVSLNWGVDVPVPGPCAAQLDCSAPEISALNTLLLDPALYNQDADTICDSSRPQFCFGLTPWDGNDDVIVVDLHRGQSDIVFIVGPPCGPDDPRYGKPSCDAPPIVKALVERVNAIDALAVADPACAAYVAAPAADAGAAAAPDAGASL